MISVTRNLPLIHAVGRAAGEPPRRRDFSHGRAGTDEE